MARARITDRDKGYRKLKRQVQSVASQRAVTVGVHDGVGGAAAGGGGASVADVASIHEYGLGNVPERSFVRGFADENKADNDRVIKKAAEQVVKGADVTTVLDRAGLYLVGKMQGRIQGGIAPPLAAATVARKGSSTPLIDTGQLISSITHEVE